MTTVIVTQVTSRDDGGAYLNTDSLYGSVSAWGMADAPTIFITRKNSDFFMIKRFDTETAFFEWKKENYKELTSNYKVEVLYNGTRKILK